VVPVKEGYQLSEEMHLVMTTWSYRRFLKLLRDNWTVYSTWLDATRVKTPSSQWFLTLRKLVASTKVKCIGYSNLQPLEKTTLPLVGHHSQGKIASYVPILDIPDDHNPSWIFLEHFGVQVKVGLKLYLDILETRQSQGHSDDYTWIYEAIQGCDSSTQEIR